MKRPAVFLDRDGTIIEDTHYPRDPAEVRLLDGAIAGLKALQEKGYLLFIISNQSGLGRGIISDEQFEKVHERVCELLKGNQIEIREFAYCFHRPDDQCRCRKPNTALVRKAFEGDSIDWKNSYVVGDKLGDLQLGKNIGAQGILVLTGKGSATLEDLPPEHSYRVYPNLKLASEGLPLVLES